MAYLTVESIITLWEEGKDERLDVFCPWCDHKITLKQFK